MLIAAFFFQTAGASQFNITAAARTGIHCRNQNKAGGESVAAGGPGNGDIAVFQRLSQNFQRLTLEFRQLIQKENAIMGEADLSGTGIVSATDQSGIRDGMMRRTERSAVQDRFPGGK